MRKAAHRIQQLCSSFNRLITNRPLILFLKKVYGLISGCALNALLPWHLHASSINPIFYGRPRVSFRGWFRA